MLWLLPPFIDWERQMFSLNLAKKEEFTLLNSPKPLFVCTSTKSQGKKKNPINNIFASTINSTYKANFLLRFEEVS